MMLHVRRVALILLIPFTAIGQTASRDPCEDLIASVATVVSDLDDPFFHSTKTSLKWWIVEHGGVLEDTMDGVIDSDDLLRVEHTSNCVSTHQGEHEMPHCSAVATSSGVELRLDGGMPAYASSLTISINSALKFKCRFEAIYPSETSGLRWKILSKEMRLKSSDLSARRRIFGWISVTFEEVDPVGKEATKYVIQGYFKPVIQNEIP